MAQPKTREDLLRQLRREQEQRASRSIASGITATADKALDAKEDANARGASAPGPARVVADSIDDGFKKQTGRYPSGWESTEILMDGLTETPSRHVARKEAARRDTETARRLEGQGQPLTLDDLMGQMRADSAARNTAKVNSQMDRMLGAAGASRRDTETARRLEGQGQPLTRDDLMGQMRADSAARQRADDNAARVNSQMDRMLGAAGASRRDSETARRLEDQGQPLTRDDLMGKMRADSATRQARKDTEALKGLKDYDFQGAGRQLADFGGGMLDGLFGPALKGASRIATSIAKSGEPPNPRLALERESKELEAERAAALEDDNYTAAYEEYKRRAQGLGIAEGDLMSPEEFVDDMLGIADRGFSDFFSREAEPVSGEQLADNMQAPPLNLDGELGDYSRLPDEDNASRLRSIINDRKAKEPDSPLAAGVAAAAKATRVDPYTGLPMVEGGGNRIEGVPGRDGAPSSAQQFTRATPPEVMEQANQLPTAAERDLYIGRNAIDMDALPMDQRERAARDYAESRRKLRERGNMVPAATDPKTGFYVEVDENNNIKRDKDGNSIPILDADGKPRRSEISSSFTEDGNVLPGSQDVVFIRSEGALKRGEQRKKFNARMQDARSSGNNLIMSFVSRDPETGSVVFDEAGFEEQFPGTLPAEGPERSKAISQLTNMIERGRAVQQNRDRLGKAQMDRSPTYGPIRMMESLQQAESPEEAMAIAMYFNRPDLAQMYQQHAMGDRAILAEEQKARAAAEVRAAGRSGDINIEGAGAGSMQYKNRMKSGQLAPGQMANELITSGVDEKEARRQEATTQIGISLETGVPADAALNAGNVKPIIDKALETAVPDTGYLDWMRSPPGGFPLPLDTFDTIRANFIADIMAQLSIPAGKGFEEALGDRFDRRMGATGRKVKERGVGEPDAEATMPPAGVGG